MSNDPGMSYCRQLVKFASLAGRTYEKLYSPNALSQPDEIRTQRVLGLSQELSDNRTKIGYASVMSIAGNIYPTREGER
jgi:hypothetical protein